METFDLIEIRTAPAAEPVHLPQPLDLSTGPLEPEREPMCVVCEAAPPAEADDDGHCVDCAVQFFIQHPDDFDDTPERYFALSADLTAVRDRVCMERVRARGLTIQPPAGVATPAHRRAAEIIAREATLAAKGGDAEVAELLLRAAVRVKDAA